MFRLHNKKTKKVTLASLPRERISAIRPGRDWKIMLAFFSLLLVFSLVYHARLWWRISQDTFVTVTSVESSTEKKINKNDINALISEMDMRASSTEMVQKRKTPFIDPSL